MYEKIFFIISFIVLLIISRLIPHPPNFTPIIAASIFGPVFLSNKIYGIAIPIIAMFISDLLIGTHTYQFIVYGTLISISLLVPSKKNKILFSFFTISSCVWFFITTNFAVWALWDFYPKTFEGLLSAYILAVPFFKNTLLSTLFFAFIFWHLHSLFIKSNFSIYFKKMILTH